jgi:CDP-diacylglycerol--glycerol-3-phosphate 3-phosphatidyltransferase
VIWLAAVGVVLAVLTGGSARRPGAPPPDRGGYFGRWSELHGGYDPLTGSAWLRGWLTMVFALGRPLARLGVQPDVLTAWSVWLAGVVVGLAWQGRPVAAGLVLVASALLDNLDGCVAVLTDRATRWGYVVDSVADRVTDSAYVWAAVLAGCPVGLGVACGFGCFLLEYLRARAGNATGDDVGTVTVAERPTRVILLSAALVFSFAVPAAAGVALLLGFTVVGLGQVTLVVRRQLTG